MTKKFILFVFLLISSNCFADVLGTFTYTFNNSDQFVYSTSLITVSASAALTAPFSTANPSIYPVSGFIASECISFVTSESFIAPDIIKYVISVNSTNLYWNSASSTWDPSSGYTQSNSSATIQTNISSLVATQGALIYPVAYLHSANGTGTPQLNSISLSYKAGNSTNITICQITGELKDSNNNAISGATITATPGRSRFLTANNVLIIAPAITTTTGTDGTFSVNLVRSALSSPTMKYQIKIVYDSVEYYKKQVTIPSQSTAVFGDL